MSENPLSPLFKTNEELQAFRETYLEKRQHLIDCLEDSIIDLEKKNMDILAKLLTQNASLFVSAFEKCIQYRPFWYHYSPEQRGRKPKNISVPWIEVGDKSSEGIIFSNMLYFGETEIIGFPFGHDIRFLTTDAILHIDVKTNGPNDPTHEVVASPNQVTGDGIDVDEYGVFNSIIEAKGPQSSHSFQPELPPFIFDSQGNTLPVLTYYVKLFYKVIEPGNQPLEAMHLICVPNGLVMFDRPNYKGYDSRQKGLLIPGKDEKSKIKKRVRIRFNPLKRIDHWRIREINL